MSEKRRSRFDPDYEEETGNLFAGFDDTDDEYTEMPKRSRFDDDKSSSAGSKKKRIAFYNTENDEAFGDYDNDCYEDDYEDDDDERRAPFLVRAFAWIAVCAVIFAIGYFAANYFFSNMSEQSKPSVKDQAGAVAESAGGAENTQVSAKTSSYKLYVPNGKDMTVRSVDISGGTIEQDMEKLLTMYFETLRENGIAKTDLQPSKLFKSNSLVYLHFDSEFEKFIGSMDEKKAREVIGGIVTTLSKNFRVSKVKFYINNGISELKLPVDLSETWGL